MSDEEVTLVEEIASFTHNPLGFVLFAFDWGVLELQKFKGPEPWQILVLEDIGARLRSGELTPDTAILEAISSGHGVGKSALVAWLILWALATCEDTRGVVTANTEKQLKTKTWAELAKWHRLSIVRDWFHVTATAIYSADQLHEKTWRIDMVPWTIDNTEAFAGLHNQGKRILVIMDEASAIPDLIWEVTEGALTDANTEIIWLVCGNPTRNSGRFAECEGRYRHRWKNWKVDSREVSFTNKAQIDQWIADEGEDSDFIRVRVRGLQPSASMLEFIGMSDVDRCEAYRAEGYQREAKVAGVDVARFGDDQSGVFMRQGRKTTFLKKWRGLDTQQSAAHVVELDQAHTFDAIFVDGGGVGGGVVDRLRVLLGDNRVIEVNFGSAAKDDTRWANRRAELWGTLRDAMRGGLEIPAIPELRADLTGPLYTFTNKQQILLEKKESMKKRGLSSPDLGDALALTFSEQVLRDDPAPPPTFISPYRKRMEIV